SHAPSRRRIEECGSFQVRLTVNYTFNPKLKTMTTIHHGATIHEGDWSLIWISKGDLSVFKRRQTLNVSFVSSRSVGDSYTRPGVCVILNSNTRRERVVAPAAYKARIVESQHNHDPIADYL